MWDKTLLVYIFPGITDEIDEEEIRNISSAPNQNGISYWTTPNFDEISGVVGTVINSTCTNVKEQNAKFCVVTSKKSKNFPEKIRLQFSNEMVKEFI